MRHIAILTLDVAVFLVNLRSLRETGLLLMNRLGHKDAGIVRSQFQKQGRAVFHHRDELFIAHPGGVKENVVTEVTDGVNHLTGVVDRAVVGAQLNDSQTEGALLIGFFRRHFTNEPSQIVFIEAVRVNAADKTVGVAGGFQVNRRGAGLQERAVVVGLVVIAVKEHQITRSQNGVQYHFVGSRSTV